MALRVGESEYTDALSIPPNDTYLNNTTPYFLNFNDILSVMPVGVINMWTTNVAPTNYMICDGSLVNRTTYNNLFKVIGTTYGAGDGTTTFNLPNLLNKTVRGLDLTTPPTQFNALNNSGGADTVVLNANNLPLHTHAITDPGHTHVVNDPGHTHVFNVALQENQDSTGSGANFSRGATNGTVLSDSKSTGISLVGNATGATVGNNTTTNSAVNIINPYITLNYIIKVQ